MIASPKWTELRIDYFRGLQQLHLTDLGNFNVLVGANDVGKTSVLEAVFLLSGLGNINLPIRIQNFRSLLVRDIDSLSPLLHGLDLDRESTLEALAEDGSSRTLTISIPREVTIMDADSGKASLGSGDQSSSSIPTDNRILRYDVTLRTDGQQKPISFAGSLAVKQDRIETDLNSDAVAEHTIPARFISANAGYDSGLISDAIVKKQKTAIVKYLRAINPAVSDVSSDGTLVYADIGLRAMLPINMLGNGLIRTVSMLAPCILGNDRMLLIDEIENGLHHQAISSLLRILLKLSCQQNMQIFVTTHSRAVVTSLWETLAGSEFEKYRDQSRTYALQRDKDNVIRPYRYRYEDIGYALEHGIEIR